MELIIRVTEFREPRLQDLRDFAPLLSPEGSAWTWAMARVEFNGFEDWRMSALEAEEASYSEPHGLELSFDDVMQVGDCTNQLIWGEFLAASQAADALDLSASATEAARSAEAGLAAVDSSFWLIGGPRSVVERAEARLAHSERVGHEDWVRGP